MPPNGNLDAHFQTRDATDDTTPNSPSKNEIPRQHELRLCTKCDYVPGCEVWTPGTVLREASGVTPRESSTASYVPVKIHGTTWSWTRLYFSLSPTSTRMLFLSETSWNSNSNSNSLTHLGEQSVLCPFEKQACERLAKFRLPHSCFVAVASKKHNARTEGCRADDEKKLCVDDHSSTARYR